MAIGSRKSKTVVANTEVANPALDLSALIAEQVAKALSGLALPAASGKTTLPAPKAKKAEPESVSPPVTVIPEDAAVPLRLATGYRDKTTGEIKAFKGNAVKMTGFASAPYGVTGPVALDLIAEILDRADEIAAAIRRSKIDSDAAKSILETLDALA